jgi:hypothetical protein
MVKLVDRWIGLPLPCSSCASSTDSLALETKSSSSTEIFRFHFCLLSRCRLCSSPGLSADFFLIVFFSCLLLLLIFAAPCLIQDPCNSRFLSDSFRAALDPQNPKFESETFCAHVYSSIFNILIRLTIYIFGFIIGLCNVLESGICTAPS